MKKAIILPKHHKFLANSIDSETLASALSSVNGIISNKTPYTLACQQMQEQGVGFSEVDYDYEFKKEERQGANLYFELDCKKIATQALYVGIRITVFWDVTPNETDGFDILDSCSMGPVALCIRSCHEQSADPICYFDPKLLRVTKWLGYVPTEKQQKFFDRVFDQGAFNGFKEDIEWYLSTSKTAGEFLDKLKDYDISAENVESAVRFSIESGDLYMEVWWNRDSNVGKITMASIRSEHNREGRNAFIGCIDPGTGLLLSWNAGVKWLY